MKEIVYILRMMSPASGGHVMAIFAIMTQSPGGEGGLPPHYALNAAWY
jgi:hypothetical protein